MSPSPPRQWLWPALLLLALLAAPASAADGCYDSIISFGDSLADTGNFLPACVAGKIHSKCCQSPYGVTYFHRPTGRFSDGRIMIDFIAQAMGMPFVKPYLGEDHDDGDGFRRGANFAVGGATALDSSFFLSKGLDVTWTNYSLSVQLQWFKQLLPTLCTVASDCNHLLSNSLILMGEIGGNDYNHAFFAGRGLDEIRTYVPHVIAAIGSAVTELIELGGRTLVVPGNFPIGCVPAFLTLFLNSRKEDYDPETGCIKWLNELSVYHDELLLEELQRLRQLHPQATIIYADYYNAAMRLFQHPQLFGFGKAPLVACCGGGGPYNYDKAIVCGFQGFKMCSNTSSSISWDGMHFTEAAYRVISMGLLGQYTVPSLSQVCPHMNNNLSDTTQQHYSS